MDTNKHTKNKLVKEIKNWRITLLYFACLIFLLAPIFASLIASLQTESDLLVTSKTLRFGPITFDNYLVILGLKKGQIMAQWTKYFSTAFINSVIVSFTTSISCVFFGLLSAYTIVRLKWKGKKYFFYLPLLSRMMPEIILIIPLFMSLRRMKILNTLHGLILTEIGFFLPFAIFILIGFLSSIPWELEDAARIDGLSRIKALFQVIIPISLPGITACAVVIFLLSWHMLVVPLIIVSSQSVATLPVILASSLTDFNIRYTQTNAFVILSIIPTILLVIILQKYVVSGLTTGSVKG